MRRVIAVLVLALVLLAGGAGYAAGTRHALAPQRALAADECQTFPETGKQVCGRFLEYWRANGGLAQQGLPLSEPFDERSDVNGQTYKVQYFERAVFEAHPENQRPYDVLLSLVGREKFQAKYPAGLPGGPILVQAGQTIIVAGDPAGVTIRAVVTDVQERQELPKGYGQPGTEVAGGKFVVILFQATNLGSQSGAVSYQVKLRDGQGRSFDLASGSVQRGAEKQYNRPPYNDAIQPGLSADRIMVFDVAPDARNFALVSPVR